MMDTAHHTMSGATPESGPDLRMRPRFTGMATVTPMEFREALEDALSRSDNFRGSVFDTSAVVKVAERDRHFWSPQLHLALESADPPGSFIRGRFSPHPTVWSGFLALYLAIAFSGIIGVIFGASQWTLGTPPTGFIAGPAAIFLTVIVYLAARIGRRLGRDQMTRLRQFLLDSTPFQPDPHV